MLKDKDRQKAEGTKAEEKAGLLRHCVPRNDRIKVSRNDNNGEGERRFATTIYQRLDREIHGLLADLGLMQQRTDEFVDQEELVKRFIEAWVKVVDKVEEKVIKQIEAGKKVKI